MSIDRVRYGAAVVLLMKRSIVAGLTFYLNGYTGPRISDLELKRLIAVHGGNVRYARAGNLHLKVDVLMYVCLQLSCKLVVYTCLDHEESIRKQDAKVS